jgi:Flp pilus assembly protein TadD
LIDNDNRVQGSFVSQTRDRWFIKVVLLLAVVGFVGLSMVPLISTTVNESQPSPTATPVAGQSPAGQQLKLDEQARGFESVLQREPENQTALRGLVETRLQQQNIKGAIAPLEKLATLNPTDSKYGTLLAEAKQQLGDQEGSAAAYRAVLKTEPGNINALQGLASSLLQQNQPQAAVSLLQDTLSKAAQVNQTQPGSIDIPSVQLTLGQVYAVQKNYDQAIAVYDQLIKTDKQDFRPVLAKAITLKQQGKTDEAKSLFENAATLAPAQYKSEITRLATQAPAADTASPTPTPNSSSNTPSPTQTPNSSSNTLKE